LLFFLLLRSLSFDVPDCEPEYDSGSSAKLIRFGVDTPDDDALPITLATPFPNASDRLIVLGDGNGVGGTERTFNDECAGGDGGRVDIEWRPLVKSRDIEAVAVDVP